MDAKKLKELKNIYDCKKINTYQYITLQIVLSLESWKKETNNIISYDVILNEFLAGGSIPLPNDYKVKEKVSK